jgi:hypothetical protein
VVGTRCWVGSVAKTTAAGFVIDTHNTATNNTLLHLYLAVLYCQRVWRAGCCPATCSTQAMLCMPHPQLTG